MYVKFKFANLQTRQTTVSQASGMEVNNYKVAMFGYARMINTLLQNLCIIHSINQEIALSPLSNFKPSTLSLMLCNALTKLNKLIV